MIESMKDERESERMGIEDVLFEEDRQGYIVHQQGCAWPYASSYLAPEALFKSDFPLPEADS